MNQRRLRAVTIAAHDIAEAGAFLAAVCGATADDRGDHIRIPIDDAALNIGPASTQGRVGITGIEVGVEVGVGVATAPGASAEEQTYASLNGLDVTAGTTDPPPSAITGDTVLDHVAVAVSDLEESAQRWEAATGATAELIGVHPASNGSLLAARLSLGDRMVELLSPVSDVDSAIASRLQRHGEGPIAIALPANDINSKREQLDRLGVRLLWQAPHWLIHPANPANVLIQLTPRVQH